jgi:hypothetical protein
MADLSCSRSLSLSLQALSRQKSSFLCGGVHASWPDLSSEVYSSYVLWSRAQVHQLSLA